MLKTPSPVFFLFLSRSVRCLCSRDQSGLSRVNVCVAGGSNSVGEHQRVRLPARGAVLAFLGAVRQGRCQVPLPLLAQERVSSFTQVCTSAHVHIMQNDEKQQQL